MIIDLNTVEQAALPSADVCIVGAGIVGLSLAHRLRKLGKRVVVLERGNRSPSQAEVGEGLQDTGSRYSGGLKGRAFGLGGTSGLWGGQLIGTTPEDRMSRPWMNVEPWPVSDHEINSAYQDACSWLNVPPDLVMPQSANESSFGRLGQHFLVRRTFSLPFTRRNFAELLRDGIEHDPDLIILLNACASGSAELGKNQDSLDTLVVHSRGESTLSIHAKVFVVCAGAIESTRLLQLLTAPARVKHPSLNNLGKNFRDHISIPVGKFSVRDQSVFFSNVSPRFERAGLLHPRFELSAETQKTFALPSAFLHVVARSNGRSVLDAVRRILGQVQLHKFGARQLLIDSFLVLRGLPELAKIIYWRVFKKALYYPSGHEFILQADLEQVPRDDCHLSLAATCDGQLVQKVQINWGIGVADIRHANKLAELFAAEWAAGPVGQAATIDVRPVSDSLTEQDGEAAYDVYHPIGSTAFGMDPEKYAVDENLCIRGFSNLFTSSTAALPSSGCANPTLSAVALAFRLACHIAASFDSTDKAAKTLITPGAEQ